jgi:hypothetical protein
MQKRVIGIIMGCGYRGPCREVFKELKILPLSSQYIFSLLVFNVNNRDYFVSNSVYHTIIPDREMIYTNLRELLACVRREFIVQASKSLTVLPEKLRILPARIISLKFL